MEYTAKFIELVKAFSAHDSKYPETAPASVAQFILESGRGSSLLAREHNNFAGLKWRPEMKGFATPKLVEAPSETADFCHFETLGDFVHGYWAFLGRDPYKGWEAHTADPFAFIDFVGKVWASDPNYREKLKDLVGEARLLLEKHGAAGDGPPPCCGGMGHDDDDEDDDRPGLTWRKPAVRWDPSPFNWSRGGTRIDTIVMHYTTSRSLDGTVSWFKSPGNSKKTAAHYVIGRDGTIVQMVKDAEYCYHGNSQNRRSIGIEHSAAAGDAMTDKQEAASAALVGWLMHEYGVDRTRVIGHKCAPRGTDCPGDLFKKYGATAQSGCDTVTAAIQKWLTAKVLGSGDAPVV